jgi:hypothetical protein
MNNVAELIPVERIQNFIFLIRGEKVMLDSHLAELYGVDTGTLNRAAKRNTDRFPEDFMFQLTDNEVESLRCQIGISNVGRGGRRYLPYAFTEQGVAMLSSRLLATNEALARKFAELERRLEGHDQAIKSLFDAIRELMSPPAKPRREIGFHAIGKEAADDAKTMSKRKRIEKPGIQRELNVN